MGSDEAFPTDHPLAPPAAFASSLPPEPKSLTPAQMIAAANQLFREAAKHKSTIDSLEEACEMECAKLREGYSILIREEESKQAALVADLTVLAPYLVGDAKSRKLPDGTFQYRAIAPLVKVTDPVKLELALRSAYEEDPVTLAKVLEPQPAKLRKKELDARTVIREVPDVDGQVTRFVDLVVGEKHVQLPGLEVIPGEERLYLQPSLPAALAHNAKSNGVRP